MSITLSALQKQRTDTAANWTAENPTLLAGELGFESDTGKAKLGTGSTAWNSLGYLGVIPSSGIYPLSQLLMPSGTAAAPSLSFDGDTDTGIYRAGVNTLAFATNGTTQAFIDGTGDVYFSEDVTVLGDLTVNGTTTTIDTETLLVKDKNIEMGVVTTPTDTTADGGGITLKGTTDKTINWINATDAWTSSERFDFPAGTEAAPSIILNGDVNSGIYQPGADQVAISTGGSGRLFVNASGNVGVGVAGPNTTFHVAGSATINDRIYLQRATSSLFLSVASYWDGSTDPLTGTKGDIVAIGNSGGDGVAFVNANTEQMRLTSTGLGLGTGSPTQKLEVQGSGVLFGNGTSDVDVILGIAGYGTRLEYSTGKLFLRTNNSNRLTVDNIGNVGIGTTSAQGKLVVSNGGANGIEFFPDTDSGANSTINSYNRSSSAFSALTVNAAQHIFLTASSEAARIDSSKRLLVGTTTARSNFYGSAATSLQVEGTDYANSGLSLVANNSSNASFGPQLILGRSRGPSVSSNTVVQSDDTLGILTFHGNDGTNFVEGASISALVDGTPGANDLPTRLVFSTNAGSPDTSPTERMRVSRDGFTTVHSESTGRFAVKNVGTNAADAAIYLAKGAATITSSGTTCFVVRQDGDVENTNNSYGALSDVKLKENIVDANSQWSDLKALQVRNYNFKAETGHNTHTQIGVIAQEAELVSPGLVSESPDRDEEGNDLGTTTKSVNYSVLYMKAVKALQEAMERIETLEAKVAALEAQ